MATKTEFNVTGLFDQAVQTFGDSLKAGVKMQEDIARWWGDALEQAGPMQQWQKRSTAVFGEAIPAAQKNTEEWLRVFEQNYRRSMDLLRKAFETNGHSEPKDLPNKTKDLWEASLQLFRDNAQALTETNLRMMTIWAGMIRKSVPTQAEVDAAAGAAAAAANAATNAGKRSAR